MYFKKCLTKLYPNLKLCIVVLTKNNICLLASQMQIYNMYSLIESAVVRCCLAGRLPG